MSDQSTSDGGMHDDSTSELDKAFAEYLKAADSGTVEVSEFLDRYPRVREELEQLIQQDARMGDRNESVEQTVVRIPSDEANYVLPQAVPKQLGDFTLIREIGRGGMGVVFEARQEGVRRSVAVKILPPESTFDKKRLRRFKNEVSAVGQLDHPNIVPVYTANAQNGIHYYAMKYIGGVNLAEIIGQLKGATVETRQLHADPTIPIRRPVGSGSGENSGSGSGSGSGSKSSEAVASDSVSIAGLVDRGRSTKQGGLRHYFRSVAQMIAEAADALHYAHEMGVIHRDIKPANLMLEDTGNVWVTDFGLAQIRNVGDDTQSGTLIGTLRYMSPEQAYARVTVDHRTDVYSLGVTLFELLTLERAFDADNQPALLHKVAFEDPKRPRSIRPTIPVDLETITLKAISKKPDDRYDSGQAFAADLRRFLARKPILAKPPTLAQRLAKWTFRNRTTVAFIAVLALLTTAFGTAFAYQEYQQTLKESEIARTQAANAEAQAKSEQTRRAEMEKLFQAAESQRLAALSALELPNNPGLAIRLANHGNQIRSGRETRTALHSALEQNHELKRIQLDRQPGAVILSPNNRLLLVTARTSDFDEQHLPAPLIATNSGQQVRALAGNGVITSAAFSPKGGRVLAVAAPARSKASKHFPDGRLSLPPQLFETSTGKQLFEFDGASVSKLVSENFSPSGHRIVLPAGQEARVYDSIEGSVLHRLEGHGSKVTYAAFSPGSAYIATIDEAGAIKIWSASSAELLHTIAAVNNNDDAQTGAVSFSLDGNMLLVTSSRNGTSIYSLVTGEKLSSNFIEGNKGAFIESAAVIAHRYEIAVRSIRGKSLRKLPGYLNAISHDGNLVATTTDEDGRRQITLIETLTGKTRARLGGHLGEVKSTQFSTDGRYVVSVDNTASLFLWDIKSGSERSELIAAQPAPTFHFKAAGQNSVLVSSLRRMHNSLYDLETGRWTDAMPGRQHAGGWDLEHRLVVDNLTATILNGDAVVASTSLPTPLRQAILNRRSEVAMLIGENVGVWIWHYSTGQIRWIATDDIEVSAGRISPTGSHVALGCADGILRIVEVESESTTELKHDRPIRDLRYSPDGKLLATCQDNGQLSIWSVVDEQRLFVIKNPSPAANRLQFSADGKYLLSFRREGSTIASFSVTSGEEVAVANTIGKIQSVKIHPTEPIAFIASLKGLFSWNYIRGELQPRSTVPMRSVELSEDGTKLIAATYSDLSDPILYPFEEAEAIPSPRVELSQIEGDEESQTLTGIHGTVINFDKQGSQISKSEVRFGYMLVNAENGETKAEFYDHTRPIPFAHKSGPTIVTAGWDATAIFKNIETGKTTARLVGKAPNVCGDGSSSHVAIGATNGDLVVSEIATGKEVVKVTHPNSVSAVSFHPDGKQVVSTDLNGGLISTDITTGVSTETKLDQAAAALSFSPTGDSLLVLPWGKVTRKRTEAGKRQLSRRDGDSSNDVLILESNRLQPLKNLPHNKRPYIACWSPSGKDILVGTVDSVFLWPLDGDEPTAIKNSDGAIAADWVTDSRIFIQTIGRITVFDIKSGTATESVSFSDDWMGEKPDGLLRKTLQAVNLGDSRLLTGVEQKLRVIAVDPAVGLDSSDVGFSESETNRFLNKD